MTRNERVARAEWRRLRADHRELYGWSFEVNGRLSRALGRCVHGRQTVELGRWTVERCDEAQVLDTVRHEVAHAIVGPGHGHGPIWKAHAAALGAKPEACAEVPENQLPRKVRVAKYTLTCERCGAQATRQRLPRRVTEGWADVHHPGCGRMTVTQNR